VLKKTNKMHDSKKNCAWAELTDKQLYSYHLLENYAHFKILC